jgi:beta-glucanase (GH16 family)
MSLLWHGDAEVVQMRRASKAALGVLVVLAIAIWDVGLPGRHTAANTPANATPSASPSPTAPTVPNVPGVIHPVGRPEFTATFTGSNLDRSVWDTCYPWLSQQGCRNFGNAEETEWYLPSQDRVSGGVLHLVAERKVTEGTALRLGPPKEYDCRSGMITSYPGLRFKYGYLQIVARIPSSPGLWPALWLDPANLTWPPEMDIVESWGDDATAGSFFHPTRKASDRSRVFYKPASRVAGWHTFALSWTKTQMTWLIDGKVTMTVRDRIPHEKMIIIANLASYKPIGGYNQCDGEMLIRSVKVWKA